MFASGVETFFVTQYRRLSNFYKIQKYAKIQ